MIKVKCFVLILVLISSLFSDNLFPKSKWQISNEYAQKDNVFFYDSIINSNKQKSKFPIYFKEFLFASGASTCCLGTGVGVIGGYVLSAWGGEGSGGIPILLPLGLIITALTPFSAAYGTCKAAGENVGLDNEHFRSSCLGAVCGILAGGGLGLGTEYVIHKTTGGDRYSSWQYWWLTIPLAFLGNSIGSVIGYNLSLPKKFRQGYLYQHFDLPSFSMITERTQEGKTITSFNFRLTNSRF